jgi:FixJ family two-component response regulator
MPVISVVDNHAPVRAAAENLLKSRGYIAATSPSLSPDRP